MRQQFKKNINKINGLMKKTYETEVGRWILAVFVSFFVLGIIFLFFRPVFMTIDDPRVRYVYAGYATGEPLGNYLFCNVILGSAIAWLYRLAPGVSWYVIYHILLIGLSSGAIGKTVYKLCCRKGIKASVAVFIHISSYLALCVISTIIMHFEITAVITGTAAIVLLLGLSDEDRKVSQYVDMAFSAISLFVTFLIAKNNLYAICCYLLVILVYHLLQMRNTHSSKIFVRLVAFFLPLTAAGILSAFLCNNIAKSSDEWQDYLSYNKYRVSYWDYPHVTYEEDPELFESIGWSEEFYDLAEQMYFMDERFNEEALSSFVESFSWFKSLNMDEISQNAKESVLSLYREEPIVKFQTVLALFTVLLIIRIFYKDKNKKKNFPIYFSLLCNIGGTVILMSFLAIRARFPLRAWLSCFVPFGVIILIQMLRLYRAEKPEEDIDEMQCAKRKLLGAVIMTICCFMFLNTFQNGILTEYHYRVNSIKKVISVENYCISNKENIYIYDPYFIQNYSALDKYSNTKDSPLNMLVWGSSYIYTPAFYQQLEHWGYESFSTENLFDKDVYVITSGDRIDEMKLFLFLKNEYAEFKYEIVDWIMEGCAVYKLYKG